MKTRLFLFIILGMIGITIFYIPQAFALSCGIPLFTESYERHDLLLHGKLIEKKIPDFLSNKHTTLILDTIKVYKGEFSETFTIKADLSWDDYYREGQEYVLFADKDGDRYLRDLCVPDYLASPSMIKFLDGDFRNSETRLLYDLLEGSELKDIDIRMNAYSNLNRAEIADRNMGAYVFQSGNYAMTWFGALQIMMIVLPIVGIIITVIFIIRRKRK